LRNATVLRKAWQRGSFKLRLTVWYAAVMALVLGAFAYVTFEVVEHRLRDEIDRQLRIDFDLVEAQLETDGTGGITWPVQGAHGDEGFARLAAWFEVWSEDGRLLLRRWPAGNPSAVRESPAPQGSTLTFYESEVDPGVHVRIMERPARVVGKGVMMRLFRDETDMRRTLQQIVDVFLLASPFAVLAASLGGYAVARRSLRPVAEMAARAARITSESLSARLPNSNPADEFGRLATVFNATLARLESSFEELKRFTADASHELRTPLTALRAVGEVAVRRGGTPAELRETVLSMLEEAERLDALIESLLTMARLDSDKSALRLEPLNAMTVCKEVAETLLPLAQERRQTLEVDGYNDVAILGDRLLLRQALLNVVHNAIRNSPDGAKIEMRVQPDGAGTHATLTIKDEGPGIAAEHQARIFDRFFRADAARSRSAGGFGLGLAIAKRAIERQGGRIDLESTVGEGSSFHFRLQVAHSATEP
jgi:heavy metal sensor kinase